MYNLVSWQGDAIMVPQLIFSKLMSSAKADSGRFRVALYAVKEGSVEPRKAAKELSLAEEEVVRALEYWEGAGLLEKGAGAAGASLPQTAAIPAFEGRKRLNSSEVAAAATQNEALSQLMGMLQQVMGGVISQADINVFVTLHIKDEIPCDLILLAAHHCACQGKRSARYVEKFLLGWKRDGILCYEDADAYLQRLEKRGRREKSVAKLMGANPETFTIRERKLIAQWYEDFEYDKKMIEAAQMVAGENRGNVQYIGGILKKWYGKSYKTPKDVRQKEENHNVQVHSSRHQAVKNDVLKNIDVYVPLDERRRSV